MIEKWHGTHCGGVYHKCNCEECIAAEREYSRAQRLKHYGKHKEKEKKYREANREKKKGYDRLYYIANADKKKKQAAEWIKNNPEKSKAIHSRWKKNHAEQQSAQYYKRRFNILSNGGIHTAEEWLRLLEFYGRKCLKCGTTERIEKDHVVPLAIGGKNDIKNLQPLCRKCNPKKNDEAIDYRPAIPDWVFSEQST